jgi:hypothetical protein
VKNDCVDCVGCLHGKLKRYCAECKSLQKEKSI